MTHEYLQWNTRGLLQFLDVENKAPGVAFHHCYSYEKTTGGEWRGRKGEDEGHLDCLIYGSSVLWSWLINQYILCAWCAFTKALVHLKADRGGPKVSKHRLSIRLGKTVINCVSEWAAIGFSSSFKIKGQAMDCTGLKQIRRFVFSATAHQGAQCVCDFDSHW